MKIYVLHKKFSGLWREYEHRDVSKVCEVLCRALKAGKVNNIDWVKKHWSQVCSWLVEWEGIKK